MHTDLMQRQPAQLSPTRQPARETASQMIDVSTQKLRHHTVPAHTLRISGPAIFMSGPTMLIAGVGGRP